MLAVTCSINAARSSRDRASHLGFDKNVHVVLLLGYQIQGCGSFRKPSRPTFQPHRYGKRRHFISHRRQCGNSGEMPKTQTPQQRSTFAAINWPLKDHGTRTGQAHGFSFIMAVQSRTSADGCFHPSLTRSPPSAAQKFASASYVTSQPSERVVECPNWP
jgi:hypothetical protein